MNNNATGGILQEKMFLEILQDAQENPSARVSFLIKLQATAMKTIIMMGKIIQCDTLFE